ncbi:MAG: DUF928 domain-containing protein [Leptolyngbya sp. SIO3F4]|nr:DUF928 domain-containing protein [Leptolyngbya sp. SIO3F4]
MGSLLSSETFAKTTPSVFDRSSSPNLFASSNSSVLFEPPTDEKVDDSRGGASRPAEVKCIHDDAYTFPMRALIPKSGVGLTVSPHPTLLVYVPPTQANQAHLTLRNADQSGLYQSRIQIPQTGGILQIALPADSPELTVGQTYDWSLALLCQPTQTDLPIANGQIRRVELSLDALSEQQSLMAKAIIYGQSGVWHDMLATLVTLLRTQPNNRVLHTNWTAILQSEELDEIADTPWLN